MRRWRILSGGCATVACAVAMGCGGGTDAPATTNARVATGVRELAQRLTVYTGVRVEVKVNTYLPSEVRLVDELGSARFGSARLQWIDDEQDRRAALGASEPDADGWYVSDGGEDLAMAFGPHLMLSGYDFDNEPGRPADLLAAGRAVRAAYEGRPELLPAAERSCALQRRSPLRERSGACALDGVPTTFVSAPAPLETDVLEARVTGLELRDVMGEGSLTPERAGAGQRFVAVAYRMHNPTRQELLPGEAALRVGEETIELDRRASLEAGPSYGGLGPGEDADRVAVFRVARGLAARARPDGALVLPVALRSHGLLDARSAQGWIRLARAPRKLPAAASPSTPSPPRQTAPGPPDIPVRAGSGLAYGAAARGAFHASMFFPVPGNYRPGPVRAGTVAGGCRVPTPTRADRDQIADMARAAYPKDRLHGIVNRSLLLAECGAMGDFGIVFWGHDRGGDTTISGVEIIRRQGRWVEHKGRFYPGCTIPLDAAAAWQIDVSPCPKDAPRPHPRGDLH